MAEKDFDRFVETHRIDMELEGADENDVRDKLLLKAKCLAAMKRGELVIEDDGTPVLTPPGGEPIRFYRPNGYALVAMDRKKEHASGGKLFASLAALTGQNESLFSKLHAADIQVCQALWSLFLV